MGLPYSSDKFYPEKWEDDVLHQMTAEYHAIDGCVAICVHQSGAWELTGQGELVQLDDGSFLAQSWYENGSKSELSERRHINLDIDLRSEFAHLKSARFKLRSMLNKNPNLATKTEYGRVAYLYIVVGNEAEWLGFPRHIEGVYENNALNRICDAMARAFSEDGEGYFSLIDKEEAKRITDTIEEWPMFELRQTREQRREMEQEAWRNFQSES
jgi:hypothetical protein